MKFKTYEITKSVQNQIKKELEIWDIQDDDVELFNLPMGIIAKYINSDKKVEYRAFTDYGSKINCHVWNTFEKAALELMYKTEMTLIIAAERVLNV